MFVLLCWRAIFINVILALSYIVYTAPEYTSAELAFELQVIKNGFVSRGTFIKKTDTSPGFIPRLLISIRHRRSQTPAVRLILSTMLVHSWGEIEGAGVEPRWRGVVEWKGVQSISRKSVCTARSPNAATLSSYSFDRDPLSLCTQSLMALFKDRNRSMSRPRARPRRRNMNVQIRLKITFLFVTMRQCANAKRERMTNKI